MSKFKVGDRVICCDINYAAYYKKGSYTVTKIEPNNTIKISGDVLWYCEESFKLMDFEDCSCERGCMYCRDVIVESSVEHPSHYNQGKYEAIAVIEDWQLGFNLGNTVKYISRAGKKDPNKELEDLKKALWYLQREISNKEKK